MNIETTTHCNQGVFFASIGGGEVFQASSDDGWYIKERFGEGAVRLDSGLRVEAQFFTAPDYKVAKEATVTITV